MHYAALVSEFPMHNVRSFQFVIVGEEWATMTFN